MSRTVDLLVRSSAKIIAHYRWLLQRARDDGERAAYERLIVEEERLVQQLLQSIPGTIQS
ncbi:hypothetical protein ABIF68_010107 [Bradyrhizobium japonicum]|jgi:hypothetical protein|uniref:hypothetical protein n=1 Tax=Bradyrhizobium liaoningense TaxID=43992 RepID=UPI00057777DD|nr:hypothetical protein [Bradyrhizobium liaoningense]MBR0948312.1 hypothetical protein [Bradyrhizobium liaoningense]